MAVLGAPAESDARKGIAFILVGMLGVSISDMLIKLFSADYPLHEMIFVRALVALSIGVALVQVEGGFAILKTDRPFLHGLRCLLIVTANLTYFAALAVLPLAEAAALWFVAPLLITLFSIPLLGEKVGPWRMSAVVIGFCGILMMLAPAEASGGTNGGAAPDRLTLMLPIVSAVCYALMQILTRRLGVRSKASAMTVYVQVAYILVSLGFLGIAGDGRYAAGVENESVRFLLHAWRWPDAGDLPFLLALGISSGIVSYSLSQAYRVANAATIAPFEYGELPLAIFWGWAIFGQLPGPWVSGGIMLIVGAGLIVFLREHRRSPPAASRRPVRRW